MSTRHFLLVETSPYEDHSSGYQRSIDKLSALRTNFNRLCELGHLTLQGNECNHTGMAAAHESLEWLADTERLVSGDWFTVPAADAVPSVAPVKFPCVELPSSRSPWQIRTASRWFWQEQSDVYGSFELRDVRLSVSERIRVAYSLLVDSWIASFSLIDSLLRVFSCMEALRTAVFRRLSVRTFVLLLLAVCRRYGHRAEPDDHTFLYVRRYLTSMGSCPQA